MTPQEQQALQQYGMSPNEYFLRVGWDRTTAERDNLKKENENITWQIKALSAVRKGLESALKQALEENERLKKLLGN